MTTFLDKIARVVEELDFEYLESTQNYVVFCSKRNVVTLQTIQNLKNKGLPLVQYEVNGNGIFYICRNEETEYE